jgi:hypothetical protein
MMNLSNYFRGLDSMRTNSTVQANAYIELSYKWLPVFTLTYPFDFLFLCSAKLLVLDRMSEFLSRGADFRKQFSMRARIVMSVVILVNLIGLAANIAATVHYQKSFEYFSAANVYFSNNQAMYRENVRLNNQELTLATSLRSVQAFCEVVVLVFIILAFVVVGLLCARRVSSLLTSIDTASTAAVVGRTVKFRVLVTTAFVFVAFLLRAVFSIMYAVAQSLQDISSSSCAIWNDYCHTCHNVYTHIWHFILSTPEFPLLIVLVSSPLTLLVALWGMTPRALLAQHAPENLSGITMSDA